MKGNGRIIEIKERTMEWVKIYILGCFIPFFVYLLIIAIDIRNQLRRIEYNLLTKFLHFVKEHLNKKERK